MFKDFATTKNNLIVRYNPEDSHASTHFADNSGLEDLVVEVLQNLSPTQEREVSDFDLGRTVGKTDLVKLQGGEETYYAKRPLRDKYSHFVKDVDRADTSKITVDLKKKDYGYELHSAWIGGVVPGFLYGKDDPNDEARLFWKHHALVEGKQEILPETITKKCPW